jgi:type II secretory ATPase GspE/PulE/Tfp pilus assembly ATPase PilB-like protein
MPTALADHSERVQIELAKGPQASVIALTEALLAHAHSLGASDLHLDPRAGDFLVRLRVDGELIDAHTVPRSLHAETISRIKVLAGLRTDEHQAAQDGRFKFTTERGLVDVRVSIVPTYHGENAVLRLLAPLAEDSTLEALGFSPAHEASVRAALGKPSGMILVTGPTGSGKTSTLYALVKQLIARNVKIITIEDPIEYAIEGVSQIPVNTRTALTFAHGLRSMLRQDPNVIMVGEIRDAETAGLAVNAALTGHLVLSTLHTADASSALVRLLDLKVEPYLIASTVSMIIAERLVRRVCSACAGAGCVECSGSGYRGRVGIFEVLTIDEELREAVLRKASAKELLALARKQGVQPLTTDGFEKVAAGITTREEVLRVCHE